MGKISDILVSIAIAIGVNTSFGLAYGQTSSKRLAIEQVPVGVLNAATALSALRGFKKIEFVCKTVDIDWTQTYIFSFTSWDGACGTHSGISLRMTDQELLQVSIIDL